MRSREADHVLDAREIDGEPFSEIMAAVNELDDSGRLLLIQSFEPTPLYDVLSRQGYTHETAKQSPEEWHVEITPQ